MYNFLRVASPSPKSLCPGLTCPMANPAQLKTSASRHWNLPRDFESLSDYTLTHISTEPSSPFAGKSGKRSRTS